MGLRCATSGGEAVRWVKAAAETVAQFAAAQLERVSAAALSFPHHGIEHTGQGRRSRAEVQRSANPIVGGDNRGG